MERRERSHDSRRSPNSNRRTRSERGWELEQSRSESVSVPEDDSAVYRHSFPSLFSLDPLSTVHCWTRRSIMSRSGTFPHSLQYNLMQISQASGGERRGTEKEVRELTDAAECALHMRSSTSTRSSTRSALLPLTRLTHSAPVGRAVCAGT